ncbi:uncharacterized protein RVIR1_10630 [Candidatus Rickettsiella viridis]|uniref:RavJ-like C-terminal domain-containing protein n=1 Tax=Candidatus Rickettsiella viridis TaxID=676208 RepID=A0A2Z5V535_9COXI|nr:DUF5617 domain-containing protein [Candidatus Rickettsiella viridis]BBB15532.1 uncharacterized protein RVIR1_10630 [Candidatus Rickettsiella viridis]
MIKRKEGLNKENKYSYAHANSLFKKYFEVTSPIADANMLSIIKENAQRRVASSQEIHRLAKENSPADASKKADVRKVDVCNDIPLAVPSPSPSPSSSSLSSVENGGQEIELKLFLREMEEGRKKCELVFGHKQGTDLSQAKRFGIQASRARPGCYKKDLDSTVTRGSGGWSEFVITYDNKFILNYTSRELEKSVAKKRKFFFNHQTMGYGTFLKAAGKIKINNEKLIISPCSEYLELGWDYVPIILFVLQEKGLDVQNGNILIADEQGYIVPLPAISQKNALRQSERIVPFYFNEDRFPLAKAIAENKELDVKGIVSKLLLSIDDSILSTRNKKDISELMAKKNHLKIAIVDFLLLLIESDLYQVADKAIEESFSNIIKSIQLVKANHRVDLDFVKDELDSWIYYLFGLGFQTETKLGLVEKQEGQILLELFGISNVEANLKAIKAGSLPQRHISEHDLIRSPFIRFYSENPTKTCIALLRNYTKGGFFWRLFTGAWRRHHIKAVEKFLKKYDAQQYPDNLSIQDIFRELFNLNEGTLAEYKGKKGTLFARLLFCEKLENGSAVDSAVAVVSVVNEASSQHKALNNPGLSSTPSSLPTASAPITIKQSEKPINRVVSLAPTSVSSSAFYVQEEPDSPPPLHVLASDLEAPTLPVATSSLKVGH